jgi:hypothetical protein
MTIVTETDPATGTGIEMDIETEIGIGTTDSVTTGVEMVIVTIEGTTVSVVAPAHETVETGPLPLLSPTPQLPHRPRRIRGVQLHL